MLGSGDRNLGLENIDLCLCPKPFCSECEGISGLDSISCSLFDYFCSYPPYSAMLCRSSRSAISASICMLTFSTSMAIAWAITSKLPAYLSVAWIRSPICESCLFVFRSKSVRYLLILARISFVSSTICWWIPSWNFLNSASLLLMISCIVAVVLVMACSVSFRKSEIIVFSCD